MCLCICFSCPAFAEDFSAGGGQPGNGGAGRQDALSISTSETAEIGDNLSDAMSDYGGKLPSLMDSVLDGWGDMTSGVTGVTNFFADTVGSCISALPASFSLYLVMLCVCVAVVAIILAFKR